jgi:hypothetical protein
MICYSLVCSENHTFKSWFANNEAYEKLKDQNLLSCSVCGTGDVDKAIMAPNVTGKSSQNVDEKKLLDLPPSPVEKAVAALKNHIQKNSEDVGNNFAVIARKMYHGDTPERNIHGKASPSEAKSLSEDGVPIVPLPWFDKNTN